MSQQGRAYTSRIWNSPKAMSMLRDFRLLLGCVLLLGPLGAVRSAAVHACSVCIAYPQKSAADYLIDSPCVIFAREDSLMPFSYSPVEFLKGRAEGKLTDLFVDSQPGEYSPLIANESSCWP